MKLLPICAVVWTLALPWPADAADGQVQYRSWGAGTVRCDKFQAMVAAQNADFDKIGLWVAGYLTAYNLLSPNTYDIVPKDGSVSAVLLWMNGYCTKHPEVFLANVVQSYTTEHKDQRVITEP
jgi:hypothetical protein